MLEAAIFDMDGLLIDSEPLWQEAEMEVFASVGVQLSRVQCAETKGRRVDETVAHWYERRPWEGATRKEVEERLVGRVIELIREKGQAKDGLHHALAFFRRRGPRLALASSSGYPVIRAVLEKLGIEREFEVVHSATKEKFGKPHPAVYRTTARKLAVDPGRCLALEDSLHGVLAAKAAGMMCVAVPDPSTGDPEHDRELNSRLVAADLVLPSLSSLDEEAWRKLTLEASSRSGGS